MTNTRNTEIITMPLDVSNQTFTFSLDVSHVIGLFQSNVLVSLDDSYAVVELLYSNWMSPMQHWHSCCWMSPTKLLNYYAIIGRLHCNTCWVVTGILQCNSNCYAVIKCGPCSFDSVPHQTFLGERRVCYSRVIVTPASQTQVLMRTPKRTDTDTCWQKVFDIPCMSNWAKENTSCPLTKGLDRLFHPQNFFRTHRIEFCLHVLNWDSQSDTDESIDECIVCDRPDPVDSKDETIVSLGHCDSRQTFLGDVRVP